MPTESADLESLAAPTPCGRDKSPMSPAFRSLPVLKSPGGAVAERERAVQEKQARTFSDLAACLPPCVTFASEFELKTPYWTFGIMASQQTRVNERLGFVMRKLSKLHIAAPMESFLNIFVSPYIRLIHISLESVLYHRSRKAH